MNQTPTRFFARLDAPFLPGRAAQLLAALVAVALLLPGITPLSAQQTGGEADDRLATEIRSLVDTPPLDGVHWGIRVVDAETGRERFDWNGARRFIPASNMKIIVSAAALLARGPEWRFSTEIWRAGPIGADGVIEGDLIIPATGDPTLSERFWDDDEAPLRALVDSLLATGVTGVRGSLVVDRTAWDTLSTPSSWMVGNIPGGFSAAPATFAVGEGALEIVVEAGAVGELATISRTGGGSEGFVVGRVVTVAAGEEADIDVDWRPESGQHAVSGTIEVGDRDEIEVAIRRPEQEAAARLMQLLDSAGVQITEGVRIVSDTGQVLGGGCLSGAVRSCATAFPVAALQSPPLLQIVKALLEPSQNWITEQVMRSMDLDPEPFASRGAALDTIEAILGREAGVDSLDLSLQDGSGLSAYNLITPRSVTQIMSRMSKTAYAEGWRDALAAPGEEDSTLENRLGGFESRVQAKTGTISNVNSLSGYLEDDAGRVMIFSILTNGSGLPSSQVRRAIDGVVRIIAGVPQG